jgi:hypothetical protein
LDDKELKNIDAPLAEDDELIEKPEKPESHTDDFQKIEKPGLFGTIIGFFKVKLLGMSDPAYEKYMLLKEINNQIKSMPIVIYNPRTEKVTKKFGKLLFELYRYVFPLSNLINMRESKEILKQIKDYFVTSHFSDKQKQLYMSLKGDGIKELIFQNGLKASTKMINENYKKLQKSLDKDAVNLINMNYSIMYSIDELLHFDLYPLLKKFSPKLPEGTIEKPPAFRDVEGKWVVEDFKNLCYVLYSINVNVDFTEAFRIYGKMKGTTIISDDDVKAFQKLLRDFITNDYLSLLIRVIDENPFFRPVYNFTMHNIVQEFFTNLSTEIRNVRENMINKLKNEKVNAILKKLFGTADISTLSNYTKDKSEVLYKKGVRSFDYVEPLNYLKMFIKEIYNSYIMDTANKFLIESNFADKKFNQKFSVSFLDANDLMKEIQSFDIEYLGSEKVWGRIKSLLPNVMREQKLLVVVNKEVDEINNGASMIITKALNSFESLLYCFKTIVGEYKKSSQDIITNIKTIGGSPADNKELVENIVRAYNDMQSIYALIKFIMNEKNSLPH